ncbi:MAG: sugar ABC transporter permease [Ruminococcaceae bacterium]|nr:sugar ABC transporter permease [Oscillospiraceae bacterium]
MKKNWVAYAMLAPYYIVFLLFTIVPVIVSLVLSFFEFNMIEPPVWVGIQNYTRLFLADDLFVTACKNTLIFASIIGPVSYIMSFCVAWFINELGPKLRAVVTLIFYAPNIGGSVYLIWKTLFSSDSYGYVNGILLDLGIITKAISFFEDAKYIMPLCIVVALWLSLGTSFLNFIAGLQGVDHSLYEAGAVDGISNRWQELWYITLPYMKPQLLLSAVLAITQAFGFGQVVNDLCGNPSTDYAAWTIMHHLDDYGGARFEIGYASAIATVLFIVMVGTNQLVKKLLSKVGQ